MDTTQRWIIHVDLDAFFASVEELLNPELRGKPIIVGGRADQRGVVAAASYAVRAFGVRSAMPTAQALRLCPQAILVSPRHNEYGRRSRAVMDILHEITPQVEQFSIDEAFLDVTGCELLWGQPEEIARLIQTRIKEEQHLPASLGVASSKLVAKIACDWGKPQGLVVVQPGEERAFLAPLPIERLWGVGKVTGARLRAFGLRTIGDLAAWPEEKLVQQFGDLGRGLYLNARGIDRRPVGDIARSLRVHGSREQRSISQERTFSQDVGDRKILLRTLLSMTESVAARLRRRRLVAQTVRIKLRRADFTTFTRQQTLDQPTDQGQVIYERARRLLERNWREGQMLRLLGVGVSGLLDDAGYQLSLFDRTDQRRTRLNRALDDIQARFGREAITRASLLEEEEGEEE